MSELICYEQPLNERNRVLLRLEFLFQQLDHALVGTSTWDSRAALQGLFDILEVTRRNELKKELLQELQRHELRLNRLGCNAEVDTAALTQVLQEIEEAIERIENANSMAVELVRQSEFIATAQQRFQLPGGACQFNLPALHCWLQQALPVRDEHLWNWMQPFAPMREALFLILRLIRGSAIPHPALAVKGFFQCDLVATAPNQLIRLWLEPETMLFPEISSGKQRFTIHFFEQPNLQQRAIAYSADVNFKIACCVI